MPGEFDKLSHLLKKKQKNIALQEWYMQEQPLKSCQHSVYTSITTYSLMGKRQ